MLKNKVVKLSSRPSGFPSEDTWVHETQDVKEINDGEILLKNLNYWNVDLQEAYFSPKEANKKFKILKK